MKTTIFTPPHLGWESLCLRTQNLQNGKSFAFKTITLIMVLMLMGYVKNAVAQSYNPTLYDVNNTVLSPKIDEIQCNGIIWFSSQINNIPVDLLPPGIYVVKLASDQTNFTTKFIKQ